MIGYQLLNTVPPQTVVGPGVSASPLGCSNVLVQATTACFICVSANGLGTDGGAVGPTNGHYLPAGGTIALNNLDPSLKIGVNTGTIYVSCIA
jgi:hypothetical protein